MSDVVLVLALIGAWSVASRCWAAYRIMFGDRSGNSGRMKHWIDE